MEILLPITIQDCLRDCATINWSTGRAKTPGLNDRKSVHISIILTDLRSFNRGSFRVDQLTNLLLHSPLRDIPQKLQMQF